MQGSPAAFWVRSLRLASALLAAAPSQAPSVGTGTGAGTVPSPYPALFHLPLAPPSPNALSLCAGREQEPPPPCRDAAAVARPPRWAAVPVALPRRPRPAPWPAPPPPPP